MDGENGRGPRRRFSPELKLQAIQEARQGGVPINRVCEPVLADRPGKYAIRPVRSQR